MSETGQLRAGDGPEDDEDPENDEDEYDQEEQINKKTVNEKPYSSQS